MNMLDASMLLPPQTGTADSSGTLQIGILNPDWTVLRHNTDHVCVTDFAAMGQWEPGLQLRFVGTGVQQIFPLQVDPCPAQSLRQALGKIKRRRPAHIMRPQVLHLRRKGRVLLGLAVFRLKLQHQGHQRLSNIASAKLAEPAIRVRPFVPGIAQVHESQVPLAARRKALTGSILARRCGSM